MEVHLVDGTYELFRHYYALPSARDRDGREVAAVRGVLASVRVCSAAAPRTLPLPPITSSSLSATHCGRDTRPAKGSNPISWRSSTCSKQPSPRPASWSGP